MSSLGKIDDPDDSFNPEALGDEIAAKTDWKPLQAVRSRGLSCRMMKQISLNRIEYKSHFFLKIFPVIFIVAGIVTIILPMVLDGFEGSFFGGLIFTGIGYFLYRYLNRPIVFDLDTGKYWKGSSGFGNDTEDCCTMQDLYAIQLLSEWITASGGYYTNVQVNIILKDGSRLNVVAQDRDIGKMAVDAEKLANFLNVPLWNAAGSGD